MRHNGQPLRTTVNAPNGLSRTLAYRAQRLACRSRHSGARALARAGSVMRRMADAPGDAQAGCRTRAGRTMKRLLGCRSLLRASACSSPPRVRRQAGTSASSQSHLDFDAIAAAGPSALPALIERGRELFKAKFTTVDGAGRPKATQAIIPTKRKNGVNPPFSRMSGPDSNSCFGCHNDPVEGGVGRRRRQRLRLGRLRERAVRLDRSLILERASHRSRSWAQGSSSCWRAR